MVFFCISYKVKFQCQALVSFDRGTIETILTGNILNWHGWCTTLDRKALQRLIKITQNVFLTHLSSISEVVGLGRVKKCLILALISWIWYLNHPPLYTNSWNLFVFLKITLHIRSVSHISGHNLLFFSACLRYWNLVSNDKTFFGTWQYWGNSGDAIKSVEVGYCAFCREPKGC